MMTLQRLRQRKELRRRELERELERIKKQLIDMDAVKIILFGSYAQGMVRSSSDIDLLVIMPSHKSGKDWMGEIYEKVDREVDCDILAYTEKELEDKLPVSRFLRYVLDTGKVIYERGS
ncbi:MAG: nucleotidyltransferase domain-containing protein [Halobacteriota archaeon]